MGLQVNSYGENSLERMAVKWRGISRYNPRGHLTRRIRSRLSCTVVVVSSAISPSSPLRKKRLAKYYVLRQHFYAGEWEVLTAVYILVVAKGYIRTCATITFCTLVCALHVGFACFIATVAWEVFVLQV